MANINVGQDVAKKEKEKKSAHKVPNYYPP